MRSRKFEPITPAQFLTPAELGARWNHHEETIRRKLRRAEIPSLLIGRRRLIAVDAVQDIERAGLLPATSQPIGAWLKKQDAGKCN